MWISSRPGAIPMPRARTSGPWARWRPGFFTFARSGFGELWPAIVTAGWSENLKGARKFEVLGQRDDPRLVAFEAAIDFINLIGMKNIEARVQALAGHLKRELRAIPGVQLRTNLEPELSAGVVKFRLAGMETQRAYRSLWAKHRMAIAMTGSGDSEGLRLCPHIYNPVEELDRAVAAVRGLGG